MELMASSQGRRLCYAQGMQLIINGQAREIAELGARSTVAELVAVLAMQADRVALERNGELVSRAAWAETEVRAGDRLEIVHFVGGGTGSEAAPEPTRSNQDGRRPTA